MPKLANSVRGLGRSSVWKWAQQLCATCSHFDKLTYLRMCRWGDWWCWWDEAICRKWRISCPELWLCSWWR